MRLLFYFSLVILLLNSCKENTFYSSKDSYIKYYEDFDFSKLKGVREIKNKEKDAFIEIIKNDSSKLVLRIHQRMMIGQVNEKHDKNGKCLNCPNIFDYHDETFIKKNGYLLIDKKNLEEEDPSLKLDYTVFITNKTILSFTNTRDNGKASFSRIRKFNLKSNFQEEIDFYEININPNINIDFDSLKQNKNAFSYTKSIITTQNNTLVHVWDNYELKSKEKSLHISKYSGYPDGKQVNIYWNFYKKFFGNEINTIVK